MIGFLLTALCRRRGASANWQPSLSELELFFRPRAIARTRRQQLKSCTVGKLNFALTVEPPTARASTPRHCMLRTHPRRAGFSLKPAQSSVVRDADQTLPNPAFTSPRRALTPSVLQHVFELTTRNRGQLVLSFCNLKLPSETAHEWDFYLPYLRLSLMNITNLTIE
jgi:hypothetical protein